jgi:hypothetical protein
LPFVLKPFAERRAATSKKLDNLTSLAESNLIASILFLDFSRFLGIARCARGSSAVKTGGQSVEKILLKNPLFLKISHSACKMIEKLSL